MAERLLRTRCPFSYFPRIQAWIVNSLFRRSERKALCSPHFWVIASLFAALTAVYYAEQLGLNRCWPGLFFFDTVHDLHRALFFIPIIYASLIFHVRGGLLACLAFLGVVLPRALLFSPYPHPLARALVFFVPATLISLLIAALLDQIKRSRETREDLSAVYNELAESMVQLQESQEQLIQAEKLSSLGQMAASIAHEINNPLAGVLVYAQLLAKKLSGDTLSKQVALEYLAKMASEVDRSSRIIRNLLDFARPSEPKLRDVDVNHVIEDALTLVDHQAELRHVTLIKELHPRLPTVFADHDQLRQVLVNLTLNAIQATPGGGQVTVRTQAAENGALKVEVEDTGSGISKENTGKLFTPFFTTKEKGQGVGLGLAVARSIIEKHCGTIEVESEEGKGTTFTVHLPAQACLTDLPEILRGESSLPESPD
jgi:signal transduction histidine kinase